MRMRFVAIVLCLVVAHASAAQVAVGTITINHPPPNPSPFAWGWVAYIDLRSERFTPVVPHAATGKCNEPCPKKLMSVRLLDTKSFADENNALVAITANTGQALNAPCNVNGSCTITVSGLIYNRGEMVSLPEKDGPVLFFPTPFGAGIAGGDLPPVPPHDEMLCAVAGTTSIGNDCPPPQKGTLLVDNRKPGVCVIPKSIPAAARGAAGLTEKGVLILAIIQGSTDGDHGGLVTQDFALLLIELGAVNAVNFDGGGSTAFIWHPRGPAPVLDTELQKIALHPATGIQYQLDWKSPAGTYEIRSCRDPKNTECTSFRPVYASLGLQYTPPGKTKTGHE
jgi:hypothetical protein